MTRVSWRFAKTTWLAATVAVLLPALAWLQYDWANQIAEADRDRSRRTLRAAANQFTSAVDAELARVSANLQLDGAMVERRDWDAYALRYESAVANAATAALVHQVWFIESRTDSSSDQRLVAHLWHAERRSFDETAWPSDLTALRGQLQKFVETAGDDALGRRERMAATAALGDERTLVSPVVRMSMPKPGETSERFLPDVQVRGFTVVTLALDALTGDRLPALVAEHFPESADYRVAIVAKDGGRVVFESEPGAAEATAAAPDITASFLQPHVGPMMVFTRFDRRLGEERSGDGRPGGPPPPAPSPADVDLPDQPGNAVVSVIELRDGDGRRSVRARTINHGQGHWDLRVQHRAGSLDAAVAASRRRNLSLSGGVLLLLGVAVALIAVSARRAQALARQQLEFVAAVSHELRTPVAVINSAAANLADGVVGDPIRVKRYGATIQTEARRLGETVERVLQLAGLGSGRPLPTAPVSMAGLVRDVVQQSSLDAERAGVDVHVQIANDLPSILGDAGTLQSAVQNLVGNAIKYAGDDRWVEVRVTASGSGREREVRIAVEDHGPGLDADERQLVFEPFYRGRTAVANQTQGSGLGLSLVRRIADAHGGRVELATETGQGSTFTICLPAAPPTASAPEPSAAGHASDSAPSAASAASPASSAS